MPSPMQFVSRQTRMAHSPSPGWRRRTREPPTSDADQRRNPPAPRPLMAALALMIPPAMPTGRSLPDQRSRTHRLPRPALQPLPLRYLRRRTEAHRTPRRSPLCPAVMSARSIAPTAAPRAAT
jgi:hypothetical protein